MRLTIKYTLADVLELNRSLRDQRIKGYIVTLGGVCSLFVGTGVAIFRNNEPVPTPVFLAGAMFILLGAIATRIAGWGSWLFKTRRDPYEIEVHPEGVTFFEVPDQAPVSWKSFSRWYVTKNLLVLVAPGDMLVVPKRACGETAWAELQALVRCGLGNPARW